MEKLMNNVLKIDEAKIKLFSLLLSEGESISDSDLILLDLLGKDESIQRRLEIAVKK